MSGYRDYRTCTETLVATYSEKSIMTYDNPYSCDSCSNPK